MTPAGDRVLMLAWAGVGALLIIGALLAYLYHRFRPTAETQKTLLRVRTWWIIVACLFGAMMFGPLGVAILFAAVSLLALWEIVSLDRDLPRRHLVWLMLAVALISIYLGVGFFPARSCPFVCWGIVLFVLFHGVAFTTASFSRAAILVAAFLFCTAGPACLGSLSRVAPGTGPRLVFLLLLLTGLNDIAQYLWGKSFGRRPFAPRISPNKTWAGLMGGVATTTLLATVIGTPFLGLTRPQSLAAGLLIGLGGVLGDLAASAYKRTVGAGESGTLLPGHGGMIDRIDSLCVTAPLVYAFSHLT